MTSKTLPPQWAQSWLKRIMPLSLSLSLSLVVQGFMAVTATASPQFDRSATAQPLRTPDYAYCPQSLHGQIQRIIDQPTFQAAQWGIVAETLSGQVLFHRNRDRF
ncbi:MAG: hypothetical protein WBA10_02840, partial [Elainellaceae cyanobacterium]